MSIILKSTQFFQAIAGFRETERKNFNKANEPIVERIRRKSFPETGKQGYILHIMYYNDAIYYGDMWGGAALQIQPILYEKVYGLLISLLTL